MKCGIYCIEAVKGSRLGYKYIGQTKHSFSNRFSSHKSALKRNIHPCQKLQRYYNKYGEDSIKFDILMICPIENLNSWEIFFIDLFDSQRNGFNIQIGGTSEVDYKTRKNKYLFVTPDLRLKVTDCIQKLCDEFNLDNSNMSSVWNETRPIHKGWTKYKEPYVSN
jgi:hypothetical protein